MLPDQEHEGTEGQAGFMGQSTSQPAVSHYNVVLTLMRSYMILMKSCWDLNGKEAKSLFRHWITEIYCSYV